MSDTCIHEILAEINENNSSNHKLEVLKNHKDNELLKKVLEMTYDRVKFTYGVSLKQIAKFEPENSQDLFLSDALNIIDANLVPRVLTGHAALQFCANIIGALSDQDGDVFKKVINRDLRVNFGKTQINKVWKGLIT